MHKKLQHKEVHGDDFRLNNFGWGPLRKQSNKEFLNCNYYVLRRVNYDSIFVVYNCFFVETATAKTHRLDIILHAACKKGSGLLQEAFQSEGECVVCLKAKGKNNCILLYCIPHTNAKKIINF